MPEFKCPRFKSTFYIVIKSKKKGSEYSNALYSSIVLIPPTLIQMAGSGSNAVVYFVLNFHVPMIDC